MSLEDNINKMWKEVNKLEQVVIDGGKDHLELEQVKCEMMKKYGDCKLYLQQILYLMHYKRHLIDLTGKYNHVE